MKSLSFVILFLVTAIISYSQVRYLTVFQKNDKYGYKNEMGKVVIKPEYSSAMPFSEGLALVTSNAISYFIDTTGKGVFRVAYDKTKSFSSGMALVEKTNKYGFINKKGELVIKCKYDHAEAFSDSLAIVGKVNPNPDQYGNDQFVYGLINTKDTLLRNQWFSDIEKLSKDSFSVRINKKNYFLLINRIDSLIEKSEDEENEVLRYVEEMPEFPGGDRALLEFISENIIYPEVAKENNLQGIVFVNYVVSTTGKVENVKVIKSIHPVLDAEAIRVIKSLPNFKLGKQKGKLVRVQFTMPISFALY